jgi:protein TonB
MGARSLARPSRPLAGALALVVLSAASCAHRASPPPDSNRAPPTPGTNTNPRTIAPFPVPGDTSREAAERAKMLDLPRQGVTTIAPLPRPVRSAPGPRASGPDSSPPFGSYVQVDELPEAIERHDPVYPEAARRSGVSGIVQVQALVLQDGTIGQAIVVASIPGLDEAAIDCVKRWRFRPARSAGRPTAVWVAVPVRFTP